ATVRLVLRVGIAYGSDTDRAYAVMLQVANDLPTVLSTPAPSVFFVDMGDSSLDFEIRMFVPAISDLFTTRHTYYMALEKALRAEGIEIPFPQRDIHIRSQPGIAGPGIQT
ncbi:MAG: potassium efflux system protein, partial [Gammaproteobacteria bacterium]